MKTAFTVIIAIIFVVSISAHAAPKWETYNCYYSDLEKDISVNGRCHKQETEINGNFAYILSWPSGNKVTVEYLTRQGGSHLWKINGKSAVAFEVSKYNLRGFSIDLNQFLDWDDIPYKEICEQ